MKKIDEKIGEKNRWKKVKVHNLVRHILSILGKMWLLGRIIYWCLLYQISGANYLICRHFKIRHILSVLQALLYTFWARIIYILFKVGSSEYYSCLIEAGLQNNVRCLIYVSDNSTIVPVCNLTSPSYLTSGCPP